MADLSSFEGANGGQDPTGMGKIFNDPKLFAKLAANPKTAKYLADPAFLQKVTLCDSDITKLFSEHF